jgi:hypothetical protein
LFFARGTPSFLNQTGISASLDPSFNTAGGFGGGVLVGGGLAAASFNFTNWNSGGFNSAVFIGGMNLAAFNAGAFAGGGVNTGTIIGGFNFSTTFTSGGYDDGGIGAA